MKLAKEPAVHAMTDVTGFGILGHAVKWHAARTSGSSWMARACRFSRKPRSWLKKNLHRRIRARLGKLWRRRHSPSGHAGDSGGICSRTAQTSGGLLIAAKRSTRTGSFSKVPSEGYPAARIVGHMEKSAPRLRISDQCDGADLVHTQTPASRRGIFSPARNARTGRAGVSRPCEPTVPIFIGKLSADHDEVPCRT